MSSNLKCNGSRELVSMASSLLISPHSFIVDEEMEDVLMTDRTAKCIFKIDLLHENNVTTLVDGSIKHYLPLNVQNQQHLDPNHSSNPNHAYNPLPIHFHQLSSYDTTSDPPPRLRCPMGICWNFSKSNSILIADSMNSTIYEYDLNNSELSYFLIGDWNSIKMGSKSSKTGSSKSLMDFQKPDHLSFCDTGKKMILLSSGNRYLKMIDMEKMKVEKSIQNFGVWSFPTYCLFLPSEESKLYLSLLSGLLEIDIEHYNPSDGKGSKLLCGNFNGETGIKDGPSHVALFGTISSFTYTCNNNESSMDDLLFYICDSNANRIRRFSTKFGLVSTIYQIDTPIAIHWMSSGGDSLIVATQFGSLYEIFAMTRYQKIPFQGQMQTKSSLVEKQMELCLERSRIHVDI